MGASNEHVPPTDEELAALEEALEHAKHRAIEPGEVERCVADGRERNYSTLIYTSMPRLVAEVRRLRRSESSARFMEGRANEECEQMRDLYRITSEEREKVVALLTANHDISSKEHVKLVEKLLAIIDKKERTLTLPNGTVVRAGDVLCAHEDHEGVIVSAVGRSTFLVTDLNGEREHQYPSCGINWRPWSDVYPDRPVPGGGE
jgi:hypothetical protein